MRRSDLAYLAGLLVGVTGLALFGLLNLRAEMLGLDDFTNVVWTGPRVWLRGGDPYDVTTWLDAIQRVGAMRTPDAPVYQYPPWVAVAMLPFGLLEPVVAGAVWSVASVAVAIIAMRGLLRAYLPGLAWAHGVIGFVLLMSAPAAVALVLGQWPFVFLAALSSVILLIRAGRPLAAGALASFMLVKPPVFVFTAVALAARSLRRADGRLDPRFVLGAIGSAVALVALGWLLLPSWWPAWVVHAAFVLVGITPVTVETFTTTLFGPAGPVIASIVILAGAVVAVQFDPKSDAWLPVMCAFSSVATVYANTYDALLLLVPIVLAAGALRGHAPLRASLVIMAGAGLLVVVGWALHASDQVRYYAAVIPLSIFVLVTALLWPQRRAVL